jgi:tetratricopeptide (TPR) repeat protein
VSEETEGQDTGAEAVAGGVDAAAMALALNAADNDPSIAEDAKAYLRNQSSLIDIQKHHLHEQLKQLHLGIWEKRLGVLLRLATLVVGLGFAAGFGIMVWDAAHSRGLLIEPFSVPPDMASRGLTGEVVAAQLLDKLAILGTSESSRSTQSYANNWGNDIKVEIPETGVSISELERFLRSWLGHDTRISGEVYHSATGIAVTARAGANGATFTGAEGDLDALVQKSAEHVFESTQPYRYANYLDRNYDPKGAAQRVAKATQIYRKLIAGDDRKEQAWAWNGLATMQFNFYADNRKSAWYYQKALATDPDFTLGYYALAARNAPLGQEEDTFRNGREFIRRAELGTPELNPRYARSALAQAKGLFLSALGEFAAAIPIEKEAAESMDSFTVLARGNFLNVAIYSMARIHDLAAVRAYLKALGWTGVPAGGNYITPQFWNAMESGDWRGVLVLESALNAPSAGNRLLPEKRITNGDFNPSLWAFIAYAHARTGDIAGAEALIAKTASDNATAVRIRAMIAEVKGEHARADWWFARSEAQTPSIPLTDLWWGQALLKRGQPDAAIEKFTLASQKGPKFADPLEGWGEALMAKNQSHLALAKFEEADKYAPNWGRLHLKWGEALGYIGRKDEARAEYQKASTLDLTSADKAELARVSAHG